MNIDATVIQFVACLESRSTLGSFVWAYFNRNVGCHRCHQSVLRSPSTNLVESNEAYSSVEYVHNLLSKASKEASTTKMCIECCQHPLLPLYLQWEGHSVTIVGIEQIINTTTEGYHNHNPYQLLVFDPMKRGDALKDKLMIPDIDKQCFPLRSPTRCLATMQLPTKNLVQKDCQVILCTTKPVSDIKKDAMKDKPQVVTAAWEAVERFISRKKIK